MKIKQRVKVSGYGKDYVLQNEDKFTELYANAINKPKENVRIAKVEEVTVRLLRRRLAVQVAIDYEVTVDTGKLIYLPVTNGRLITPPLRGSSPPLI